MTQRDNCFDFLRLLFALIVLFGHLICISSIPELQCFAPLFDTYIAVTGFFVISGFLIAQSYDHSESLKIYFSKRCRRLLPAYFTVVLCCAFGLYFLSSLPARDYYFSKDWWMYLIANLSFMNFVHPSLPGVFENNMVNDASVNPSLWTLKVEIGFYLVLPLILAWLRKAKRSWIPLLILYSFSVIYRWGTSYLADMCNKPMLSILSHQLPGFLSYFMAGTAIYLNKDIFMKYKNRFILPALFIWLLEFYILKVEILTPLCFGTMVIWCAYSLPKLNNLMRWGDISYGVYIYNGPILKTLLSLGIFAQLGTWTTLPIYLLIVFSISLCSWKWLEKPFLSR